LEYWILLLQVAGALDTCHAGLFARGLRLEPPAAKSEKASTYGFRITAAPRKDVLQL